MPVDAGLENLESSSGVPGLSMSIGQSREDEAVRVSAELILEPSDFFAVHGLPAHSLLAQKDVDFWSNVPDAR